MWTKFLNYFGIETPQQKIRREEQERLRVLLLARQAEARRRALLRQRQDTAVIKTTDVPTKKSNKGGVHRPSQQVRAERYGYSDQDTYVPTVFMPAIHVPVPVTEPSYHYESPSVNSSHSDSSSSSGSSSDSGSSFGSSDSGGSW